MRLGFKRRIASTVSGVQQSTYGRNQRRQRKRLGQYRFGPQGPGLGQDPIIEIGSHKDARQRQRTISYRLQCPQTIEPRHVDIEQGQVNVPLIDHIEGFETIGRNQRTKAATHEGFAQRLPKIGVIIGNQQAMIENGHGLNTAWLWEYSVCL